MTSSSPYNLLQQSPLTNPLITNHKKNFEQYQHADLAWAELSSLSLLQPEPDHLCIHNMSIRVLIAGSVFSGDLDPGRLLRCVRGHPSLHHGPEVWAGEAVPHQLVQQHHPARLPVEVAVLPAVVGQPPVAATVCHHAAMAGALPGRVQSRVVPLPVSLHHRGIPLGVGPQDVGGLGHSHVVVAGEVEAA